LHITQVASNWVVSAHPVQIDRHMCYWLTYFCPVTSFKC